MTHAEITAFEIADRFWRVNSDRIRIWITEDMENNNNEPTDFSEFASKFKVNPDVCDVTLDQFVDEMLDFLDHKQKESITPKIWNHLQKRYDSLVDSILVEMEDTHTNEEQQDYYRSLL